GKLAHIPAHKKTQPCLPTRITPLSGVNQDGTKLSFNLQSQNMREPTLFVLRLRESRFRRGQQDIQRKIAVNGEKRFFQKSWIFVRAACAARACRKALI
ncbi:MAG: hypothetical protein ACR2MF_07390, partial [Chthoniobacterales bacterium]